MHRAPEVGAAPPDLDESQRRAVDCVERALLVRGAPGTGKTTVATEMVAAAAARGIPPEHCLILSPTRQAAGAARDRVTSRLRGTTSEPMSRSHQALGFGLLRQAAALRGDPTPRLLSGPEQDVVLKEILEGYAEGIAPAPEWPEELREALGARGFRAELRDLLMRAVEWGLEADDLRQLAVEHDRPAWTAAAHVLDDYDEVTALSRPGAYDPAWILGAAADLLLDDDDALARVRDTMRFIVVDDAQELTFAGARLLRVAVGPQTSVRLLTDPDSTVQGFRGADPRLAATLAAEWGAKDPVVLDTSHRQPARLREAATRVSTRIGAVDGAQHRKVHSRPGGSVEVALLRAVAQEGQHIAGVLRRVHLLHGVPWSDLAVVVRAQSRMSALRRTLAASGVPVAVPPGSLPLREEPAVRPLLDCLDVASTLAAGSNPEVTADRAVDLITSPLGGADAVALRRLRRVLRAQEIADAGSRSSDELLADSVTEPVDRLALQGPDALPVRRVAAVISAGTTACAQEGATAESVLWAMWDASNLAASWEERALAGGVSGSRADRDLDAVVALFGAAAAYVDRLPGLGPRDFLEHVRGLDVPGDSLIARAPHDECVALVTPAGASGREWHTVVVAGVQEGVWPDLRLRGSLLGSEQLVDVLSERGSSLRAAQAAVRYDETRQFLVALTRARERVVVTAVRSEDEQPSPYLDIVDPLEQQSGSVDHLELLREFTEVQRPMSLPAVVADLRRTLASPVASPDELECAAVDVARLARDGVHGANPTSWWALAEISDERPLREPEQPVRVSPSKVESFTTCGLNWLLTTRGGHGPDIGAAAVGTLIHEIAAEFADTAPEQMHQVLDERWVRLGLGSTWMAEKKRSEAHHMLTRLRVYLDRAAADGWTAVDVERGFAAQVGRARLAGQVDRIERHDDRGLRVIDYKTGGSKPSQDDLAEHGQLGAYQVAVVEGAFPEGATSGGAALVQIGKAGGTPTGKLPGMVQPQEPIVGDETWAHERVAEVADGMGAATVMAIKGERCGTCSVKRCCPLFPEGGVVG
ncbi:ATP-dependent helicase [Demetria terragena]|uniref:ATP-dependent helicase n=1 Tax=Demetria terragena TaxID=63959 RepID=UPI0003639628|nr:ATP-dependent DNA helicase [Demetria terragena]